jgi:hypothetical protein
MELETPHRSTSHGGKDRRRHKRWRVLWWGQIAIGADHSPCTVFDLAPSGAKIQTSRPTATEERVRLSLPPFGDFKGEVIWSRHGHIGIRFADEEHHRIAKIIASHLNQVPL